MRKMLLLGSAIAAPALATLALAPAAHATVLETYEFQGQPGSQTTVAPSFVAPSLTGTAFGETNVSPSAGANSINATGWTNAGAAYTFGFGIAAGYTATVNQIVLSTRSSGTGPASLLLQASADNAAYVTVAAITQIGTNYNDEMLSITPVTASSSLRFQIVTANQTAAGGGNIGSAGTFRVGDYNPSGSPTPFTLNGTLAAVVTPPTNTVPEPAALAVLATGLVGLIASRRRLT